MEPFRVNILGCGSAKPTLKHLPTAQIVDFDKGEIHVVNKNLTIKTHPLPAFVRKIAEAGGLINYVKGVHA